MKVSFSFVNDDREWLPGVEVDEVPAVGSRVGITPIPSSNSEHFRLDAVVGHRHYFGPNGQEIHVLLGEPRTTPSPRALGSALTHYRDAICQGDDARTAMHAAIAAAYAEDGIGR